MVSRCLGSNVSAELASKELSNNLCTRFIHFVNTGTAVDLSDFVLLVVILDDRHRCLFVNLFKEYRLLSERAGKGE